MKLYECAKFMTKNPEHFNLNSDINNYTPNRSHATIKAETTMNPSILRMKNTAWGCMPAGMPIEMPMRGSVPCEEFAIYRTAHRKLK